MWIFDKLFNRKIEGKSSLDDLAENVVVNKENNTTEIVGNLDVDGAIRTESGLLQYPSLAVLPEVISVNSLPLENNNRVFNATIKDDVSIIDFAGYGPNNFEIKTGNAVIILDRHIDEATQISSMTSVPGRNDNVVIFNSNFNALKVEIINLRGAVYIAVDYEI